MTTGERKIIKDFVFADDRNWTTARAIQGALPEIAADVRRQFLKTIANRLEGSGYRSGSNYNDKSWQSWVRASFLSGVSTKMPIQNGLVPVFLLKPVKNRATAGISASGRRYSSPR